MLLTPADSEPGEQLLRLGTMFLPTSDRHNIRRGSPKRRLTLGARL